MIRTVWRMTSTLVQHYDDRNWVVYDQKRWKTAGKARIWSFCDTMKFDRNTAHTKRVKYGEKQPFTTGLISPGYWHIHVRHHLKFEWWNLLLQLNNISVVVFSLFSHVLFFLFLFSRCEGWTISPFTWRNTKDVERYDSV
jgi:hypothetical protein